MKIRARACRNPTGRPHVALLIETSLASGRDILRGIARYVREHAPWSLYHEAHGLTEAVPSWLNRWRGDGIIARIQTPAMAEAIAGTGIPAIDVLGVIPDLPLPLVHVDNHAIARVAAEHLLERGLRHFGFFGIEGENWSVERWASFKALGNGSRTTWRAGWNPYPNRSGYWYAAISAALNSLRPAGVLGWPCPMRSR